MTVAPVDCSPWSVSRPSRRSTCPPPCVPARAHDSALVTGGRRAPAGTGLLCAQFEEGLAVHQVAEGTGERVPDGSAQRTGRRSEERRVGKECRSRWWASREHKGETDREAGGVENMLNERTGEENHVRRHK